MNIIRSIAGLRHRAPVSLLCAGLVFAGLTACSTTRQVSQTPKDFSGFLVDYSMLKPGAEGQANFVYINETAPWKTYGKVYIKPIQLWKSADPESALGSLSKDEQQLLVNSLHTALADKLGKNFVLVNKAEPGVLVINAAITDAGASKPVINILSTIVPIGMVVNAGKTAITGKGTGVGSVAIEASITDGGTGQRVIAVVDERAGTKALRTKFDGAWGDVYHVFDFWSQKLDERLVSLKAGK